MDAQREKDIVKMKSKVESYDTDIKEVKGTKLNRKADSLRSFEVSFPFDKISVGAMYTIIEELEVKEEGDDEGKGYLMFNDLVEKTKSHKVWREALADKTDTMTQILLDKEFAGPVEDSIKTESILAMAILYCPTEQSEDLFAKLDLLNVAEKTVSSDKAMILYKIL